MKKYRFKSRAEAEQECHRAEQERTLNAFALNALLRDEFTWTNRFEDGKGTWFQMGFAGADMACGGIVLVREHYSANRKPSQHARWADSYIPDMAGWMAALGYTLDAEQRAYRDCLYALREIYNATAIGQTREARREKIRAELGIAEEVRNGK